MENNRIKDLTNALQFYSELESLNLSRNQISDLRDLHFEAQTELRHLRLAHNAVEALHGDSFVGLRALHTLDLGHNRITSIGPRVFGDLVSLQVLVLEGNKIAAVSDGPLCSPQARRIRLLRVSGPKRDTFLNCTYQ